MTLSSNALQLKIIRSSHARMSFPFKRSLGARNSGHFHQLLVPYLLPNYRVMPALSVGFFQQRLF